MKGDGCLGKTQSFQCPYLSSLTRGHSGHGRNYAKKGYVECLSGVELVIDNYRITKFNIAGKPLDPNKTYNFATINFLLDGGEGSRIGTYADKVIDTDVLIRDAVVDHIKSLTAQGKKIDPKMDGRVVIKNVERN